MTGLKKNKKGDIPITILVIGVFAVCMLVIISFIASTITLRNSFVGIDLVKKVTEDAEVGIRNVPFYEEENKTPFNMDYLKRGLKDELLFSVKYERP